MRTVRRAKIAARVKRPVAQVFFYPFDKQPEKAALLYHKRHVPLVVWGLLLNWYLLQMLG